MRAAEEKRDWRCSERGPWARRPRSLQLNSPPGGAPDLCPLGGCQRHHLTYCCPCQGPAIPATARGTAGLLLAPAPLSPLTRVYQRDLGRGHIHADPQHRSRGKSSAAFGAAVLPPDSWGVTCGHQAPSASRPAGAHCWPAPLGQRTVSQCLSLHHPPTVALHPHFAEEDISGSQQ